MNIKTLSAAVIMAAAASTASAGGLMDEIVEPDVPAPVVMEEPAGSGSIWIPIAIIAVLLAVAAGDSGGGS